MNKKSRKSVSGVPAFERPVDRYFYALDKAFPGHRIAYSVGVFTVFFGVMGLVWMVPFPKLDFLERMNAQTFVNWGSFFIAIVVYSYLKLAPTLSYAMLLTIGIMSFFVVQVEYMERDYGLSAAWIFAVLTMLALGGLFLLIRQGGGKGISGRTFLKLLAIGPIWFWSRAFARLKWKY